MLSKSPSRTARPDLSNEIHLAITYLANLTPLKYEVPVNQMF